MEWTPAISLAITIVISVLSGTLWLTHKFAELDKDIAMVKIFLIMKNIMPSQMTKKTDETN